MKNNNKVVTGDKGMSSDDMRRRRYVVSERRGSVAYVFSFL